MSTKSQIQKVIETEIQPQAKALVKAHEVQKDKIQDVFNKLSDAIRAANGPAIQNLLANLEEYKAGPYARLSTDTRKLLARLKSLKPADPDGADGKIILALTKSLGEFEAKLNRNYAKIKAMEDMANDVLEKAVAEGGDIRKEWADMEGWLRAQLEAAKLHLQAMEALDQLAKDAIAAGDQKDLDHAIKKSAERSKWKPTLKEIQDKYAKFCAKCDASRLSKDLADQLARDRITFKKVVDELAALNKKMDEIQNRVEHAYIATVDIKALANALKLKDAKAIDRLKRALKPVGDERERALRAFQIDFKLKFSPQHWDLLLKAKTR